MKLSELKISTKTGNTVIAYFETGQGSKYLLSDKGESKRIKSVHANTGAEDQGVKPWYEHAVFVASEFEKHANAFQLLSTKQKHILLQRQTDKIVLFVVQDGKWVPAKMSDAYPKAVANGVMKDGPIAFPFVEKVTKGFHVLEYNLNSNKTVANYHFGSPVTVIKQASELSQAEAEAFADKK